LQGLLFAAEEENEPDDDHTPRRYTSSPYDAKGPVCVWS